MHQSANGQLTKIRRASAVLQAQDMEQAGISHASNIELMSDDELRLVLDERGIPHYDSKTRIAVSRNLSTITHAPSISAHYCIPCILRSHAACSKNASTHIEQPQHLLVQPVIS